MIKDKITLSYILISVLVVAGITFYVAKLDISQMNSNITKGGSEALSAGEEYSKKLYNLAVAKIYNEENVSSKVDDKDKLKISTVKRTNAKSSKPIVFAAKLKAPINIEDNVTKQKKSSKDKPVKTAYKKVSASEMTFSTTKGDDK